MESLNDFLRDLPSIYSETDNTLRIGKSYLGPGYWAAICAFANAHNIPKEKIIIEDRRTSGYASAIGLNRALGDADDYAYERHGEGKNYSTLEALNCQEATDDATGRINQCIRTQLLSGSESELFVRNLCNVVGDLHDNVWSHGMASGFSMAQKWPIRRGDDGCFLEFALADRGQGFLTELNRVGLNIDSDSEAIEWCIQEGHSSKLVSQDDDWAQRLPADVIGNPMKEQGKIFSRADHHQGLGLFNLTKLVGDYGGQLWLASGSSMLFMDSTGEKTYYELEKPWKGVAIACRFDSRRISGLEEEAPDVATQQIMDVLRGK